MNFIFVIWIVWALLAVLLLGLLLYHVRITEYEENELFLEGNEVEQHRQDEIRAKLKRLKPLLRICGGAEGIATLVLVGFYVSDALRQF